MGQNMPIPSQPSHLDISKAFEVSLDSADWSMEIGPVGKLGMKIVLEVLLGKKMMQKKVFL